MHSSNPYKAITRCSQEVVDRQRAKIWGIYSIIASCIIWRLRSRVSGPIDHNLITTAYFFCSSKHSSYFLECLFFACSSSAGRFVVT